MAFDFDAFIKQLGFTGSEGQGYILTAYDQFKNAFQYLSGAGNPPVLCAPVKIHDESFTNKSLVEIFWNAGSYTAIDIDLLGIQVETNAKGLGAQISDDGGATYYNAGAYAGQINYGLNNGTKTALGASVNLMNLYGPAMRGTGGLQDGITRYSGLLTLFNLLGQGGGAMNYICQFAYHPTSNSIYTQGSSGGFTNVPVGSINACRIGALTSNFGDGVNFTGRIIAYGRC